MPVADSREDAHRAAAPAEPVSGMVRCLRDVAVLFVALARALVRSSAERAHIALAMTAQAGLLLLYLRGEWTF